MATFGALYAMEPPWKRFRDEAYGLQDTRIEAANRAVWTSLYGDPAPAPGPGPGPGAGPGAGGYGDGVIVEAGGGGGGGGPRIEQVHFPYTASLSTRPYEGLPGKFLPGNPASNMSLGLPGSAADIFGGAYGVTGPPDHVQAGRQTDTEIVQSIHVLSDGVINDTGTFSPGSLVFQYKEARGPRYTIATLPQMNRWLKNTPGARHANPFTLMKDRSWESFWHFLGVYIGDSTQGRHAESVQRLGTVGLYILKRAVMSDLWMGFLRPGDDVMLELRIYKKRFPDPDGNLGEYEYYWCLVPIVPTTRFADAASSMTRIWTDLSRTTGAEGIGTPIRTLRLGTVIVPASSHTFYGPSTAWDDDEAVKRATKAEIFDNTENALFSSSFDTFEVSLLPT